jgi:hypothetical protein
MDFCNTAILQYCNTPQSKNVIGESEGVGTPIRMHSVHPEDRARRSGAGTQAVDIYTFMQASGSPDCVAGCNAGLTFHWNVGTGVVESTVQLIENRFQLVD